MSWVGPKKNIVSLVSQYVHKIFTLPNCQWCGEPGFAGAASSSDGYPLQIPIRESFDFEHFHVKAPYNFRLENYTETFQTIYKWNIPPIQCEKRLRWTYSMGKVVCPSLVFKDFYVQDLAPGCHKT
jgi:hypothetical protein